MHKLPTPKKARLSAEALAKSLNVSQLEGRSYLAQMFNFKNWAQFISNLPPHELPITPTEINSIHQFLYERLGKLLDMPGHSRLKELIESTSPYSSKPKALRTDIEMLKGADDSIIDFELMRQNVELLSGGSEEDYLMNMLKSIVGSDGSDESRELMDLLNETSFEDFQNKMRLSKPLNPYIYAGLLQEFLELEIENIAETNTHGEPCMFYLDNNEEPNPVFINSIVTCPGDTQDSSFFDVLSMIEGGFDEMFEKPILLFDSCLFKQIEGKIFSVVGIWNDGHQWRWLFLSKLKPWEQLKAYPYSLVDELENSLERPAPPTELATQEIDGISCNLYWHNISHPMSDPSHDEQGNVSFSIVNRMELTGSTGWITYV